MITLKEKVEQSKAIIRKAIEDHPKICVAVSFGKDSMVLLHLVRSVQLDAIDVVSVLTPFKPKETFEFRDRMVKEWDLQYYEYNAKGDDLPKGLWEADPCECCQIYKVEPLKRALKDYGAWFSGIRAGEGRCRKDFKEFEERDGLVKVNPLLAWSEMDIWKYSALYEVPQNPVYKTGLRSLGCSPCTSLIDDSEEERAGRWKGTEKAGGECGIHSQSMRD